MNLSQLWDVRSLFVIGLILHIILFVLGNYRKYAYKSWMAIPLWLAYQLADLIATATIGKLCITCQFESAPSNFLRGFWASLLLLHLGGPDTITAYAFEDILWLRHGLGLVFRAGQAAYVIYVSWTSSWLSLLNIPLFLAGLIKYLERTWCFYSAKNTDFRREAPLFGGRILDDSDLYENPAVAKIVLAHRWFALKRPDIRNHFSPTGNGASYAARISSHLLDIVDIARNRSIDFLADVVHYSPKDIWFNIAEIELKFMFDVLYTKSAIIYTKMGCFFRLISFCCFSSVFLVSIGKMTEKYWSYRDVLITVVSLVVVVALELWGMYLILSSDWFVVQRLRYSNNRFMGRFLKWWLRRQREKKRWSDQMGQLNLLRYCKIFRNEGMCIKILQKIEFGKMVLKYWYTTFECIPRSLKIPDSFPQARENQLSNFPRGEKALERHNCTDDVMLRSLSMDLGAAIMIWHIATDMCYLDLELNNANPDEKVRTCKIISDYMMYLLARKPSMISGDGNFWFNSVSRWLTKELQKDDNIHQECNYDELNETLLELERRQEQLPEQDQEIEPPEHGLVFRKAISIAEVLRLRQDRWDVLKSVWLEMMQYAAICCPSVSHHQELSQGCEILSLYWLLASYQIHYVLYNGRCQSLMLEDAATFSRRNS